MTRKLDLNALLLFYEVTNARSISAAAEKLGVPKSTISRKLQFLEDQTGAVLFRKGSRKLVTTDIGQALYEHCERIASEIEEAGLGTARMQTELRGTLRVSMPVDFGIGWLSRAMAAFAVDYPDIDLVIDANSRWVDVSVEPYDVAVQLGPLPETQGGQRHLATITRGVYASPGFLARAGVPSNIDDFGRFDCIVTEHQRAEGVWTFRGSQGAKIIDVAGRVTVNHIGIARELVVGGVGLGILPNIMCQNDIRAKRLVRVLTDWESPMLEVSATYPGKRKESRRLRTFLDFMENKLKSEGDPELPSRAAE
ncbi:MAG: LysR family transcriptional regulator [Pseudomonadota bacterium]|jgi:DNA-binding transcriptional LysR family regulator